MIMELEARLKLSDDDVFYLRHNNITLTHEVERLRDENAALQRENAALRERLEILSKSKEKQTEEYICVDREHGLWKRKVIYAARKEAQP